MKKLIGLLILILSVQAEATLPPLYSHTYICTAQYQDMQLIVKFYEREHCMRCDLPTVTYSAQIIAPLGPEGSDVIQNYTHTGTKHYRLTEYTFKKSGEATQGWTDWFAENMAIYSGTFTPIFIAFKGESLDLTCN